MAAPSPRPAPEAAPPHTAPQADTRAVDQQDNPQLAWGEPSGEAFQYSRNHTRRLVKDEARLNQGPKTRRRNREIVSGRM